MIQYIKFVCVCFACALCAFILLLSLGITYIYICYTSHIIFPNIDKYAQAICVRFLSLAYITVYAH